MPPEPPTIHEDNTFVDPGENPFVAVGDQPASTFGLDVDTGSPSVGRTFLASGSLPPPESVRVEEWVNALGSDQAAPTDADLAVRVDGSLAPDTDDGTRLVRVGVAAREVSAEERPPAHLTFVVDTSGSMNIRERLGLVKASLGVLVLNLRDDDTIAIVTYSDDAGLILEPTPVRDAQRIVDAIDSLVPGNSTNLDAGLREGYAQAAEAYVDGDINAVILASDGVANVGLTDPDGLAGVIQDRAQQGIHLVTVGYGMGNYNDDLMEQVADRGDGFYAYLDTYEQAERLFRDRLTSVLTVVAGDAKAQVTFDPAVVHSYRLLGYENRALATEDFEDDTVDAGEVGAGHRVSALYEVRLLDFEIEPEPDQVLATAAVRWRSTATGTTETVEESVTYGAVTGEFEAAPASLRLHGAAAAFADWLTGSSYSAERRTSPESIAAVVGSAAAELDDAGLPGSQLTPEELADMVAMAATATPPPVVPQPED
jgi:Ca-activated chloride channel family protein